MPTRALLTRSMQKGLQTKLDDVLADKIIDMFEAGIITEVDNAQPQYIIYSDYLETIDGITHSYLTVAEIQNFWEGILSLLPIQINALREEGITHPQDLAQFDSDDFDSVIQSMKGRALLSDLAQIRLKQACDFFQFILETGRTMKDQCLTHNATKSRVIQFKEIQDEEDSKDSPVDLSKLTKPTDILSWMDRTDETLQKLPGQDNSPLAYLIRKDPVIPVMTNDLVPGKCYSLTYKSLIEELVAR